MQRTVPITHAHDRSHGRGASESSSLQEATKKTWPYDEEALKGMGKLSKLHLPKTVISLGAIALPEVQRLLGDPGTKV